MKKKYIVLTTLLLVSVIMVGCGKDSSLCVVGDCPNNHIENVKYCISHKCLEVGCTELRTGKGYCEEHFSCIKCGNERKEGSNYCFMHGCSQTGCPELKVVGAGYCEKHLGEYTCLVPDCKNQIPEYMKYCDEHVCKSCREQKLENSDYCQTHYQEQQVTLEEERKKETETQKLIEDALNEVKDTVVVDSNGKKIWRVCMKDDVFRFKANYSGNGNFIVTMLDYNQNYYATICNEIGDYVVDKTIPVDKYGYYYIETYTSGGSWSGTWSGTHGQ